jgi:CheY-like chemotaxis protein
MTTRRTKILIAEDELIIALDITKILKKNGFSTCPVVSSGEEAIKLASAEKPDLILMDILLNGSINGIEASRIISREQNIPIIFLTGAADHETLNRVKGTEPYGYITKPYDEQTLYSVIQMALIKNNATILTKN